eukprot:8011172-Prorocentrum_lima.AAC.1
MHEETKAQMRSAQPCIAPNEESASIHHPRIFCLPQHRARIVAHSGMGRHSRHNGRTHLTTLIV